THVMEYSCADHDLFPFLALKMKSMPRLSSPVPGSKVEVGEVFFPKHFRRTEFVVTVKIV
ncbi:MAG: hypothetical protein ACE5G1_15780, partial [bacterium]